MRVSPVALLPLLPVAAGCTGAVSGSDGTGDAEAATTTAIVLVERTINATEGSRAEASARFIRVAAPASAQDALRAVGVAVDLPAPGTCQQRVSLAAGGSTAEPAPIVELLDVGVVSIEAAGAATRLLPRQLPDVTDIVNGVVYARAADPALLPPGAAYVLHVGGGADLGPLDVTATAPGDPSDVAISGEDARGTLVASGRAVDLSWTADGTDDVVYADIGGIRCSLGDPSGQASSDSLVRSSLSTELLDDAGTLVVHRLHREPLRARGFDSGEIRFDFARSIAYVRP